MFLCQHPMVLTDMLRGIMDIPSPPPVSQDPPSPEVQERLEELERLAALAYPVSPSSPLDSPAPQRVPNWGPWIEGNRISPAAAAATTLDAPQEGKKPTIDMNSINRKHRRCIITTNVVLGNNNDNLEKEGSAPAGPCGLPWCKGQGGQEGDI